MVKQEYKVILVGQAEIGKTTLANYFVHGRFMDSRGTTIGAAYSRLPNIDLPIGIWDTAGQERFLSFVTFYYRDADIVLMMYDLSHTSFNGQYSPSIDRIEYNINKLIEMGSKASIFIIGTKKDLIATEEQNYIDREVTHNKHSTVTNRLFKRISNAENRIKNFVQQYEDKINVVNYYTISCKTNSGIRELLNDIYNVCSQIELPISEKDSVIINEQNKLMHWCKC